MTERRLSGGLRKAGKSRVASFGIEAIRRQSARFPSPRGPSADEPEIGTRQTDVPSARFEASVRCAFDHECVRKALEVIDGNVREGDSDVVAQPPVSSRRARREHSTVHARHGASIGRGEADPRRGAGSGRVVTPSFDDRIRCIERYVRHRSERSAPLAGRSRFALNTEGPSITVDWEPTRKGGVEVTGGRC